MAYLRSRSIPGCQDSQRSSGATGGLRKTWSTRGNPREPLIALQRRYTNETEQAELEVSIGLTYNQRTGVVDPSKAVVHFTAALGYDLPERTYIQIVGWRGNSQEQLKKPKEALTDYLRGLLACSYYDLTGGWPEIQQPKDQNLD